MGETPGYENLVPALCADFNRHMFSECGGAVPKVHRHVEYRPVYDPQELALRMGGELEMQPPQGPLSLRPNMIILNELRVDSGLFEHLPAVGFGEEPASVAMTIGTQHDEPFEYRLFEFHPRTMLHWGGAEVKHTTRRGFNALVKPA